MDSVDEMAFVEHPWKPRRDARFFKPIISGEQPLSRRRCLVSSCHHPRAVRLASRCVGDWTGLE